MHGIGADDCKEGRAAKPSEKPKKKERSQRELYIQNPSLKYSVLSLLLCYLTEMKKLHVLTPNKTQKIYLYTQQPLPKIANFITRR